MEIKQALEISDIRCDYKWYVSSYKGLLDRLFARIEISDADIASKIGALGRSVNTEYNQVYISGMTGKNDNQLIN